MKSPVLLVAFALPLAVIGCDSDDTSKAATSSTTTTTTSAVATAEVTIEGQWARNSPMVAGNAAAYMTVTAKADDALIGASVASTVAERVELHETTQMETSSSSMEASSSSMMSSSTSMASSSTSMDGSTPAVMTMVPVDQIDLPAGEAVALKPGGYHVMLINLPQSLETGTSFDLTLDFENAADMTVNVTVRTDAP